MLTAAVMMKYIHGAGYTYMCACICMFYFIILSGTCVKYNDKKILFCVVTLPLFWDKVWCSPEWLWLWSCCNDDLEFLILLAFVEFLWTGIIYIHHHIHLKSSRDPDRQGDRHLQYGMIGTIIMTSSLWERTEHILIQLKMERYWAWCNQRKGEQGLWELKNSSERISLRVKSNGKAGGVGRSHIIEGLEHWSAHGRL